MQIWWYFQIENTQYVEQALESKELESFFTMKRVKKNLDSEDGEAAGESGKDPLAGGFTGDMQ